MVDAAAGAIPGPLNMAAENGRDETAARAHTRRYVAAQLTFWTVYALFNTLFIVLFAPPKPLYFLITLLLAIYLGLTSHGLRALYKPRRNWSLGRISLHLLWLLPLAAIAVQSLLALSIRALLSAFPLLAEGTQQTSGSMFVAYTLNTAFVLAAWTVVYLLVEQLRRRRATELAYWRSQAQLHEAELQFLRSQINSHFLFNALNNLRALIREDPEQARERLTQLAVLLRAILQAETRERVPLAEELSLVDGYLALESLQFESRLQIRRDIDERARQVDVPPLLLQTLVENAVRHGIARRPAGGCIEIAVHRDADHIRIQIRNPLPQIAASSDGTVSEGHGIGLKNARARLQKLFGARARLELRQEHDSMLAELQLPA